ncbi:MAG: ABC transporter ATP-binding protein/permease [Lachnospiraceae bacterium]|jgi:ABC-type multidrug transport system fused ATPase/permease subunit|nr:ABC transporter ATP-binding protein/permease [Lachnospiraceae bacterium]
MNRLKKIAYVFNKRQKIGILVLLIVIVIGAFLELASVAIILPFVNSIMNPDYIRTDPLAAYVYDMFDLKTDNHFFIIISVALIGLYLFKNIYIIIMNNMQYRFMYNYQRKLADKMLNCYLSQPYLYHLEHGSTEMIRNINDDVRSFFAVLISALQVLTETCVCGVFIIYFFTKDKSITIGVAFVMLIFIVAYLFFIKRRVVFMGEESRRHLNNINQVIVQSFSGIKEVKILNREKYFIENFKGNYKKYAEYQSSYNIYGLLPRPLMETVCIGGMLAVIVFKLINGTVASYFIPTISIFAIGAFRMMPSFSRITGSLNNMMFNMPSVNIIYQELKAMEKLTKQDQMVTIKSIPLEFSKEISIRQLDFRYPNTEKYVLRGVSLIIPKNKSVAFIGPSGEGKTTLADIVLGLLQAESGGVFVDSVDVQKNIAAWHQKLGYIPQSIYLMDDSIKSNIVFGVRDSDIDEQRLWQALDDAQLKDFVTGLDYGLDTQVGERGIRLSGGQRQRIAIARALYNDPEVLILDEATSALDNDTESAVMDAIDHLAGQKTLIIIAHRLSTIENCDIVYEVSNGSVQCIRTAAE